MKKLIGQTIAKGVSGAVRKTKQADTKVLNALSKPFRRAPVAAGTSVKARVVANDASRMVAQRAVKPFYRAAQVLTTSGAGAYMLNEYNKAKKVATENKDTLKKGVGTETPTVKPKSPNTVPPRAVKPVTQDWRQQAAKMKMAEKPANKPKEKVLESKSKPRVAAFLPENKLGQAKVTGGTGNKKTGYKKSSSTSRTGTKKTTGRFKK